MPDTRIKVALQKAQHWLEGQLVDVVPEEDELCEFDCRKLQCRTGDWANCKRRLAYLSLKRRNAETRSASQGSPKGPA